MPCKRPGLDHAVGQRRQCGERIAVRAQRRDNALIIGLAQTIEINLRETRFGLHFRLQFAEPWFERRDLGSDVLQKARPVLRRELRKDIRAFEPCER